VCLGFATGGQPENVFLMSLLGVYRHDADHHRYLHRGAEISLESGPRVAEARCQIVDAFARTKCDWLWMVDDDMGFEPDTLDRLMDAADPETRPMVGALCFIGGEGSRVRPTLYNFTTAEGDMEHVMDYPRDTLVKIGSTGAACVLIHRSVFAAMKARFGVLPDGRANPYPWFQEGAFNSTGGAYGEDTAFFLKASALGIPLHVHTGIRCSHMKKYAVTEEMFLAMNPRQEVA
jgi:GT2 family glycosyltransferase